ncbi:copper transport protein [Streptacidiphilus sp. MAP12-16]|uniref:copper resistance CopC/CopD family protein n=1 Tax=Streptacidiphilus sp. MAP12-16 TaxID=3156300 RepID=UPI003518F49C
MLTDTMLGACRPPKRTAAALLTLLAALLGLMLAGATGASAHAALLSTDPAQGSVVQAAPTQVTLHFSEQVTLESDAVRVFDPSGKRVDTGSSGHAGNDDSTARVQLGTALAQGTYTVAWRAISADTHPVSGAYTFSYGHASSTTAVAGEQATRGDALVGFLYGSARSVQYGAFALLAGSVALVLLCWPSGVRLRSVQRLMLGGWAALLLATVAQLLLRGPYEAATGLGAAFDLTVVQQTLGERLGTLLVVRILLLAAVGVFLSLLAGQTGIGLPQDESTDLRTERRLRTTLGIAGAVLSIALACTWALADHASVGIQVGLAVPLDVVHLSAMACWLGGLAAVLVGLRTAVADGGIGVRQVERFSTVALCSVSALVGTGVYQAWRGLGSWSALTTTTYGRLLLVKIGAVLVILAAAWMSRRWTALLRAEPDVVAAGEAEDEAAAEPQEAAALLRAEPDVVAAGEAEDEAAAEPQEAALNTAIATPAIAASDSEVQPQSQAESRPATPSPASPSSDDPVRQAQLDRQHAARRSASAQRAREASPARGMLLRSVLLEVTFAVVVLVVTTLLTNAPPGRAVTAQAQAQAQGAGGTSPVAQPQPVDLTLPFDTGGPGDSAKGRVTIEIHPARVGQNQLHAYVYDNSGKPVDVPELDVSLTLPAKSLGPLAVKLDKVDVGHWAASGLQLPMSGSWQLSVSVRSDAIDETTVTAQMQVN